MKDKYIPDLIMSVLDRIDSNYDLSKPTFKVEPIDDRCESSVAIRLSDLRTVLNDIFGEDGK